MKGIDISAYQSTLDFSKIKTDIVIIKATEGLTYVNPYLKLQYAKSKSIGARVGFYHFLRTNNPTEEAKSFLKAIEGLQSDCKYIIDIETDSKGASARVREFADYLISKGKEPCIYSGLYFYNNNLDHTVKDLPLWVAYYNKTRPLIKSVGWQYSDQEKINGQKVDMNIFDEGILLSKGVKTVTSKEEITKAKVKKFQIFYNDLTKTTAPLDTDGKCGKLTLSAYETLGKLIKGEY